MWSGIRLLVVAVGLAALTSTPISAQTAPRPLVGTFRLTPGTCQGGPVKGSTFRMVLPSGNLSGPFVSNNDSACGDRTYTVLGPGTDGGLITGSHQPEPSPPFDGNGNSLARRIITPARFYGVSFSASTNPNDPQTGVAVPPPSVVLHAGGKLTGDLRAFAASWNRQEFNQGAPKPDGSMPGNTTAPSGTYDAATGAFTLTWASQIQGGPFDRFTGVWYLEGTFVPAASGGGSTGTSPTTAPPSRSPTTRPTPTAPGATVSATATTTAESSDTTVAADPLAPSETTDTTEDADEPDESSEVAAGSDEDDDDVPPALVVLAVVLAAAAAAAAVAFTRMGAAA